MNGSDTHTTDQILPCLGSEQAPNRENARIIIPCWGEQYLRDLLTMTLPALGAPGNLPAFSEVFACEIVLVTEKRFFEAIAAHPVIA
jgi:hypothetical protein